MDEFLFDSFIQGTPEEAEFIVLSLTAPSLRFHPISNQVPFQVG